MAPVPGPADNNVTKAVIAFDELNIKDSPHAVDANTIKDEVLKRMSILSPPRFATKSKANFFSLPQRIRQQILYQSLPNEAFRRLAQIALRISQAAFELREEEGRVPIDGPKVCDIFNFFIKRYSKKLAVHWVVFNDLRLVWKIWIINYHRYFSKQFLADVVYGRSEEDDHKMLGYAKARESYFWSAEDDLAALECTNGISKTRGKALECFGEARWASIRGSSRFVSNSLNRKRVNPPKFETASRVSVWSTPKRVPKLKYHPSKNNIYPVPTPISAKIGMLPTELREQVLLELLTSKELDWLASIQFHYKRTGWRFIAAYVLKLAMILPCLVPSLAFVQKRWNAEVQGRIDDYRIKREIRVEGYQEALEKERAGLITEEECNALQKEIHESMASWRSSESREEAKLTLMWFEDFYGIPAKHWSPVTRRVRNELIKSPEMIIGSIDGNYLYIWQWNRMIAKEKEAADAAKAEEEARQAEHESNKKKPYVPIHLRIIAAANNGSLD